MNSSVRTASEELDLKVLDRDRLEAADAKRENIIWDYDGRVRVVLHAVWSNAYNVLKMYEAMKAAGRIEALPGTAGVIPWTCARSIFTLPPVVVFSSTKVKLPFDPAPR